MRPQGKHDEATGGDVRDGGPRPEIKPIAPAIVSFNYDYPVGSILIDTGARRLYYVLDGKRAYQYTISVGREGFSWTGTEKISRKQAWPDWYPPVEMRERDRGLPVKMTGGLKNPLGAMALYLGNTLYRIHGTNDANSLGRAQSSGCFRMLNANVLHLSTLADVGTSVTVVRSLAVAWKLREGWIGVSRRRGVLSSGVLGCRWTKRTTRIGVRGDPGMATLIPTVVTISDVSKGRYMPVISAPEVAAGRPVLPAPTFTVV